MDENEHVCDRQERALCEFHRRAGRGVPGSACTQALAAECAVIAEGRCRNANHRGVTSRDELELRLTIDEGGPHTTLWDYV